MQHAALPATSPSVAGPVGRYRWVICALLFFAATINYVDRQVIGILKPTLQHEFGWSEIDYADIIFAFQLAYAIGFLLAGRMIDWLGTKKGFIVALVVWSLAAMAHAEATVFGPSAAAILQLVGLTYTASVAGFIFARLALGFGEAGNFPAAIKVTAEWFPKKERALATGIFNSGTNIGALVTPLVVPVDHAVLGLVLGVRHHRGPGLHLAVLLDSALPGPGGPPVGRRCRAGAHPQRSARPAGADSVGQAVAVSADVGVCSRQVPDRPGVVALPLLDSGFPQPQPRDRSPHHRAAARRDLPHRRRRQHRRRVAVVDVAQTRMERQCGPQDGDAGVRAGRAADGVRVERHATCGSRSALVSLAASAHQGWSANLFTLTSDMFPRHAVGSVVGLGGFAGAVGGMLIAKITGYILETTGSYVGIFFIAAFAYLVALAVIHVLVPRMEPVKLD